MSLVKYPPCVNLNGSSKQSLIEQYLEVYHLVNEALDGACKNAPNGRDYQIGNVDHRDARHEFIEHVTSKLSDAKDFLVELVTCISLQG
jgi:hypothetical protein